jgi:hypothetical protein
MLDDYANLKTMTARIVRERIHQLQERIERQPKTAKWKLRSRIGERVKWYKDVEELMHR